MLTALGKNINKTAFNKNLQASKQQQIKGQTNKFKKAKTVIKEHK
jgi:hypothetical protein